MLTWCCNTALGRSQEPRHKLLGCTTQGEGTRKGDVVPSSLTYNTELKQGQKPSMWENYYSCENTGRTCCLHHRAELQPCGWPWKMTKRVFGRRLAGENEPGQTHKNSHNCLKPLWHFPVSYFCNTTVPGWSPLLLSPAPVPLPSASSPTLWNCTCLSLQPHLKNMCARPSSQHSPAPHKVFQPPDLQAPKTT